MIMIPNAVQCEDRWSGEEGGKWVLESARSGFKFNCQHL